ncbi:MAG: hypothetical protein WCP09_03395 [Candidatus Taylorbacteria bacterium]
MHHNVAIHRISTNMNNDAEACDRMFRSVICRVENFEITRSHRRSIAYSTISVIAFFALIPAIYMIVISITQSGFGKYLSLVFSDSSYVIDNWKQFLLSTVSSLPIMSGIAILLALFIILGALRRTIKYSTYSENIKHRLISI